MGLAAYLYFLAPFVPGNFQAHAKRQSELKLKYEALSSDLTKARQAVASLDRLEMESRRLHQQWASVREELPDRKELASLLRRVTLAGSQAGVHFQLFKPEAPSANDYYTDNPVRISVTGSYHQVGAFLSEIAGLPRLVNSHNVILASTTKENTDITTQANFVASAYTLGGTGPPEPPAQKDGTIARNSKTSKGAAHHGNQSVAKVTP